MKILIILLALTTAPMALADDKASYQAIKYGDVITDDGDVITDDDMACDDLEAIVGEDVEEYDCY